MIKMGPRKCRVTRRSVLTGISAGVGLMATSTMKARSAPPRKVIVRTAGGLEEDSLRKAVFEPFTAATGIKVEPFATSGPKVLAMAEAHDIQVDAVDIGEIPTTQFIKHGILEKLDRTKLKHTVFSDLLSAHDYYLGLYQYGTVLGYNTRALTTSHPKNWAEFWDVKRFPGGRTLESIKADLPNLEFALLADGVPLEKLYPLDITRAFNKLREIRPHITKWWTSGAMGAQLLAQRQVVMGSVFSGRIQGLIDEKGPFAIEWNQAERTVQALSIVKDAPHIENAYALLDFAMQPKPQADLAKLLSYGPNNKKAFQFIDAQEAAKMPTSPEHIKIGFATDANWWSHHYDEVVTKWQAFVLGQ